MRENSILSRLLVFTGIYILLLVFQPGIACAVPTTGVLAGGIALNEILIDPNSATNNFDTDGNGTANDTDEFIEIYNLSGSGINISDFQLWDRGMGHWFTFPGSTILGPGNYAVVVRGVQTGGSLPPVSGGNLAFDAGWGSAAMNNNGDNVVLYDPGNDEFVQILYNDASPDNPPGDYLSFSGTATRIGSVEDWGNDVDGVSLVRDPAGDTNIVVHNSIAGADNASPGSPSLESVEAIPTLSHIILLLLR